MVGHNIKFDLLYEMVADRENMLDYFARGGRIWCTQYAEYLLRGMEQKYHMCSLDAIVEDYGGRKKIDGVKALWEAGVETSDIDPDLLLDYLVGTEEEGRNSGDITNTELVYLGQVRMAKEMGMYKMIQLRMDGLAATTEMEFNGLKVDMATAKADLAKLSIELAEANKELEEFTKDIPEEVGFNWGSGVHKSCLIYGGVIRYKKSAPYLDEKTGEFARLKKKEPWPLFNGEPVDPAKCENGGITPDEPNYYQNVAQAEEDDLEPVWQDKYLSGKRKGEPKFKQMPVPGEIKTKIQDFFYELPGYCNPEELGIEQTKTADGRGNPLYSTSSDTLEALGKHSDVPFLKVLSKKTALDKEIGTYYVTKDSKGNLKGMLTCVQPEDHFIHHMLNHTSTVTSRLSSSNPNGQNIPTKPSRVKAMFTSRFGDKGRMVEIDFKQLEVVVQGLLSGDANLIKDLNEGVDFHCKRVAAKNGITYEEALERCKNEDHPEYEFWSKERSRCKVFSFQRAYGAGAETIALETGMTVDEVKALMVAEEEMYPDVKRFYDDLERHLNKNCEGFHDHTMGYRPFRKAKWQCETGTIYSFRSYDAPKWLKEKGIPDTFSPTQLKNYPIQGTGGEVVQIVLGVLWRWFIKNRNFGGLAFLVNTVHDCVWLDLHEDVVEKVMPNTIKIMEGIPKYLKLFYGMECPVPFPVDAEIGPNMLDLSHYSPGH